MLCAIAFATFVYAVYKIANIPNGSSLIANIIGSHFFNIVLLLAFISLATFIINFLKIKSLIKGNKQEYAGEIHRYISNIKYSAICAAIFGFIAWFAAL